MSMIQPLTRSTRPTRLVVETDTNGRADWLRLHYDERPCMTESIVNEMAELAKERNRPGALNAARFQVFTSTHPEVFSLGGDLELFAPCIRTQDRDRLERYANRTIDLIHATASGSGDHPVESIAVVAGIALGGGFESALANHMIIAEERARFGFPECTFGMFPGMGGYSFLSRRVAPGIARRIVASGKIYTAREMFELGVVDLLVADGEGERAARRYLDQQAQRGDSGRWLSRGIAAAHPVTRSELDHVVEVWIETAMQLEPRNLRLMDYLATNQRRRWIEQPVALAASA